MRYVLLLFFVSVTAFAKAYVEKTPPTLTLLPEDVTVQNYRQLSDTAEISIITITQGSSLLDSFGHSAVRVYDPENNIDWVYNYGIYDFSVNNFYLKFAQGQLLYRLRVYDFPAFLEVYTEEQRAVSAQVLDLTRTERQKVFNYLENNAKEANSQYYYDFFYDNCATRPMDVVQNSLGNDLQYTFDHFEAGKTHRDLLHLKLPWNSWGRFLTDVPLGAVVDKVVDNRAYVFLPSYAENAFAKATLDGQPLVKETKLIFSPEELTVYNSFWVTSPLVFFLIIGGLLFWITYRDSKNNTRTLWADRLVFILTGVAGLILFLLWVATDHQPTKWNYNLLWAFPFNLLAAYGIGKKVAPRWLHSYMKLLVIMLALMAFHWIIGVQIYPYVMIPTFIGLLVRYVYVLRTLPKPVKGKQRVF